MLELNSLFNCRCSIFSFGPFLLFNSIFQLTLATASLSAWKSIMLAPIPAPWKNAVAAVPSAAALSSAEEVPAFFRRGIRTGSGGSVIVVTRE